MSFFQINIHISPYLSYQFIFPYLQLDLLRGQLVSSMRSKHDQDIPRLICARKTVDLHSSDIQPKRNYWSKKVSDQNWQLENKQTTYFGWTQENINTTVSWSARQNKQIWRLSTKYICEIKQSNQASIKSGSNQSPDQNLSNLKCNLTLKNHTSKWLSFKLIWWSDDNASDFKKNRYSHGIMQSLKIWIKMWQRLSQLNKPLLKKGNFWTGCYSMMAWTDFCWYRAVWSDNHLPFHCWVIRQPNHTFAREISWVLNI